MPAEPALCLFAVIVPNMRLFLLSLANDVTPALPTPEVPHRSHAFPLVLLTQHPIPFTGSPPFVQMLTVSLKNWIAH